MGYLSIDLGTTNIKAAVFDDILRMRGIATQTVKYFTDDLRVEFDPNEYFDLVLATINKCLESQSEVDLLKLDQIILTGQAESLVIIDEAGNPLRKGISWLDSRSKVECEQLKSVFNTDECYRTTGQPEIIPTWPITKILWIRKNEGAIFSKISKFLLLKDYIQYRFTGRYFGEYSIYNFSHYFDIIQKKYFEKILNYCGVKESQLPQLIEPCSKIGRIHKNIALNLKINPDIEINVGTLDHFSGMIGTGNIKKGTISESTGTVVAIATLVDEPAFDGPRISYHCGPFKDSYVLLPVVESGGVCLEWFKRDFIAQYSYKEIDEVLLKRAIPNEIIFLPHITGVNSPDFNSDAKGVFYGIQIKHDAFDFALAIMEGVTHLFNSNIDFIEQTGITVESIASTGGGAKSGLWSQMKADITGRIVRIPTNEEASCLGSAIIGAVADKKYKDYQDAIDHCVTFKKIYQPKNAGAFYRKKELFNKLYEQLKPIYKEF